mmetsp:Transcript_11231/g.17653  ORF Transcript_11231/g.17653 Transcript_11231/m.17653 type:complete len:205 (-) Transcript_11231:1226-1840(-)
MNASKFVVILATSTAALVALSLVISNSPSKAVTLLDVDAPTSLDRDHREWYSVGAERDDGHRHLTTSGLIKNSWPLGKRLKTQQEIDFLEQHPEYKEPEFPEAPVFRVVPREGSMQLADVDGPGSVDEPKSKWYDDGFMRCSTNLFRLHDWLLRHENDILVCVAGMTNMLVFPCYLALWSKTSPISTRTLPPSAWLRRSSNWPP